MDQTAIVLARDYGLPLHVFDFDERDAIAGSATARTAAPTSRRRPRSSPQPRPTPASAATSSCSGRRIAPPLSVTKVST